MWYEIAYQALRVWEKRGHKILNQFRLTDRGALETAGLPVNLFRDLLTLTCGGAHLCAYTRTHSVERALMHVSFCLPAIQRASTVQKGGCESK